MSETEGNGLAACVIGAGGYVGGELLRILSGHPAVSRVVAVSESRAGAPVADAHPFLRGRLDQQFAGKPCAPGECGAVFYATPPRVAMETAGAHLDAGATVVDCSPDFRIRDLGTWEEHYGAGHAAPGLVGKAAYGLVELRRDELKGAKLIAAPGCYATLLQLAIAPVARAAAAAGADSLAVVADCASGTSGAGRRADRADLLMAEAGGNFSAYSLGGAHRHMPEVIAGVRERSGIEPAVRFVPHLLPLPRGMFATVHFLGEEAAGLDLGAVLDDAYAGEPFIDVLGKAASPQVSAVCGTNRCQLGRAAGMPTVLGALDNLGKGAAGQAVQAWNVASGLDEGAGLGG